MLTSEGHLPQGFHAAQDALIAHAAIPFVDGPGDMPGDVMSSPVSSSKRRKTMRTYGSGSKRARTLAYDETERFEAMSRGIDQPQSGEKNDWLPPTLRNEFEQHNPNAMFSEPSSTVPDNTMSQRRIIEQALEANLPAIPDTEGKSDHTQHSESSIPWSAYQETPKKIPVSSRTRTNESASLPPTQPPSSAKKRSQTVGGRGRPSQTPQRVPHDEDAPEPSGAASQAADSSKEARRTKTVSPQSRLSSVSKPVQRLSEIEVHGEPVVEQHAQTPKAEVASKVGRRKTSSASPKKPEPSSDGLWVGISREQYKPRASRSRTTRVTDDQYLQAVEQTLRPKAKRRKTTHDATYVEVPEVLPMMTTKTSKRAPAVFDEPVAELPHAVSEKNKENELSAGESRETGISDVPIPVMRATIVEVSIPPTANTKRKLEVSPEKLVVKGARISSPTIPESQNVPPSLTSRRIRKANRSHTIAVPGRRKVVDSDESDTEVSPVKIGLEDVDEFSAAPVSALTVPDMPPPPEKRRGRGRPRKSDAAKATSTTSINGGDSTTKALIPRDKSLSPADDEVAELQGEGGPNRNISKPAQVDLQKTASLREKTSSPVQPAIPPPSTPEQPELRSKPSVKTPESKTAAKSPNNHSPINKGKVPYRVGLSKRARIAPLLRVMKK
jgi:hypothetical protein